MPDTFDPNAPEDFSEQAATVARQKKLAEMLRAQLENQQRPQGQMVSGHYVAPSWTQHLTPLLNQYQTGRADSQAADSEQALAQRAGAARQKWASALPQAMAARPELQGPPAIGGSPELEARAAQPLTTGQVLKHTLAGMQIPGNEKAAQTYNTGALAEVTREDQQAAKTELQHQTTTAQQERALQAAQAKLEQIKLTQAGNLTPDQKIMIKKMEADAKRDVATISAQARVTAAERRAAQAGAKVTAIPHNVMKDMTDAEDIASSIMGVATTYKPEYGGPVGAYDQFVGKWVPWADNSQKEAANWWTNYEQSGLKQRHDLFGSTLTGGEKSAWEAATLKGMDPQVIAYNLQKRAQIAADHFNKTRARWSAGGYPQLLDAFNPLSEGSEPAPGATPVPTQPPQQQRVPTAPPQRIPQPGLAPGWSRG